MTERNGNVADFETHFDVCSIAEVRSIGQVLGFM